MPSVEAPPAALVARKVNYRRFEPHRALAITGARFSRVGPSVQPTCTAGIPAEWHVYAVPAANPVACSLPRLGIR